MKNESATIFELFDQGLEKNKSDLLISTKRGGEWIATSPSEFKKKVRHFALGLYELGVRKGDKVTLHSENSTEWLIADQAILSLGAVDVPIYTTQPPAQIKYIVENSEAKYHLVSNDELYDECHERLKEVQTLKGVISLLGSNHGIKTMDSVIQLGRERDSKNPDLFEELRSQVKADDLATFIYTSGTTGLPKGVMLTHNNIAANLIASKPRVPFDADNIGDRKMLSYLPLSHVFERLITYLYMHMGFPIYYIEAIDEIRDDFEYVKPYFFATVPRLLEKIYIGIKGKGQEMSGLKKQLYYWALHLAENYDVEQPPSGIDYWKHSIADNLIYSKIRELFGGNLLGVISGGAALSPEIMKFMNAIGLYCGQGYGLSETSPVITVTAKDALRIGSSGKPLSNVEVRIAADGEVRVKGPNVMQGYYRNPEKTEEVFDEEGYFMTGDIGHLDEDNFLFITDRKKSMFKLSTGKYVAPQPIEGALANSPFIEQSVVVGYQRKFCAALVVPSYEIIRKQFGDKMDLPEDEEDWVGSEAVRNIIQKEMDDINKDLSKWEQVKKFKLLKEPLTIEGGELTPTLKVKRPVINKKYKEVIDEIYEENG